MTDAKSTFSASKSYVAPTRTECPLTPSTYLAGSPPQVPGNGLKRGSNRLRTKSTPYSAVAHFVVSGCPATNNTPKDRSFFDSGCLQPGLEEPHGLAG